MRIDIISKVVLYKLANKSDRRGAICELFISNKEGVDREQFMSTAYRVLQRIISILCADYFYHENRDAGRTEFTEQFESWINVPFFTDDNQEIATGTVVRLQHKYWSQDRIDNFIDILLAVAKANGWKVEDKR